MASPLRILIHKCRSWLFNLRGRGQATANRYGDASGKKPQKPAKTATAVSPQAPKMSGKPVGFSVFPEAHKSTHVDDEEPRGRSKTRRIDFNQVERLRLKENHKYDTFEKSAEILRQEGIEAKQWN